MSLDLSIIENLKIKLKNDLPGVKAQSLMAPNPKEYYLKYSNDFREAAVMLLLYPKNDKIHLAFIKRTDNIVADKHAGQISFPGGKMEDADQSYHDCALREMKEEIGVGSDKLSLLGPLSKMYVFVSNFMVYPFVSFMHDTPAFSLDTEEVQKVVEIPLDDLRNKNNIKTKDLTIRGYTLKDVPYYDLSGEVIWGATAMMTSELIYIIENDILA